MLEPQRSSAGDDVRLRPALLHHAGEGVLHHALAQARRYSRWCCPRGRSDLQSPTSDLRCPLPQPPPQRLDAQRAGTNRAKTGAGRLCFRRAFRLRKLQVEVEVEVEVGRKSEIEGRKSDAAGRRPRMVWLRCYRSSPKTTRSRPTTKLSGRDHWLMRRRRHDRVLRPSSSSGALRSTRRTPRSGSRSRVTVR